MAEQTDLIGHEISNIDIADKEELLKILSLAVRNPKIKIMEMVNVVDRISKMQGYFENESNDNTLSIVVNHTQETL